MSQALLPIFFLLGFLPFAWGDEAVLPNGRRLAGTLQGEREKIVFVPDEGKPLPLAQLQQVRFAEAPCPLPGLPLTQRLVLPGGQWISGELVAVNADQVHFRAWNGQELKIPRGAVEAITHPQGWHILSHEGFEKETPGWKLSDPPSSHLAFSGKKSLLFDRPGQQAGWTLAASPARGRVGFFLHQSEQTAGQDLHIAWNFRVAKESRSVRLNLDGVKMMLDESRNASIATEIRSRSGWHMIQVDFGGDSLRLSVDDLVLHEQAMKDAVLTGISLTVTKRDGGPQAAGGWSVDDVQLARPESKPALSLPHGLADTDSVWLAEGDQLFGKITQADAQSMTLAAKFGTRTFAWPTVRGLVFKANPQGVKPSDGARFSIAPAPGFPADTIEGKLLRVSRDQIAIRHAILGDLVFDRRCCLKITVLKNNHG